MPEAYDRHVVPVSVRPFAADQDARAAVLRPRMMLELAVDTGALTSALLTDVSTASVGVTDLNEVMVAAGTPQEQTRRMSRHRVPGAVVADGLQMICFKDHGRLPDHRGRGEA
jgi:hypothetical protein